MSRNELEVSDVGPREWVELVLLLVCVVGAMLSSMPLAFVFVMPLAYLSGVGLYDVHDRRIRPRNPR